MNKLPVASGKECIKALGKAGFYFKRQEGSHITLRKDDPFAQVVVPDHRELDQEVFTAFLISKVVKNMLLKLIGKTCISPMLCLGN